MFSPNKVFVIAEIGINHNGSLDLAKQLIDAAKNAGCDAVKFQKRTPALSLPPEKWGVERDTPWGVRMTYLDYRHKIELSSEDYLKIDEYCKKVGILWGASPWDCNAADTLYRMDVPFFKVASAGVTNLRLLKQIAAYPKQRPVIISTGMSDIKQVVNAVRVFRKYPEEVGVLACTSKYPAEIDTLNLARIVELKELFPWATIGYSGHESGLWTTLCAVGVGARIVERHITLDRTMKGSDHAASVEPQGFAKLVKEIRNFERAYGSRDLTVQECEKDEIGRLRYIAPGWE